MGRPAFVIRTARADPSQLALIGRALDRLQYCELRGSESVAEPHVRDETAACDLRVTFGRTGEPILSHSVRCDAPTIQVTGLDAGTGSHVRIEGGPGPVRSVSREFAPVVMAQSIVMCAAAACLEDYPDVTRPWVSPSGPDASLRAVLVDRDLGILWLGRGYRPACADPGAALARLDDLFITAERRTLRNLARTAFADPGRAQVLALRCRAAAGKWHWVDFAALAAVCADGETRLLLVEVPSCPGSATTSDLPGPQIEHVPGVGYVFDLASEAFTWVSPRITTLLGHEREAWFEPGFWASCLHPDDRRTFIDDASEDGLAVPTYDSVYRLRHRDGHYVWIRDVSEGDVASESRLVLHGVMVDITSSYQREARAAVGKRLLAQAFAYAGTAFWEVELATDRLRWDGGLPSLYGYRRDEMPASMSEYRALLHPDDAPPNARIWNDFLTGGGSSCTARVRLRARDGSWRWIKWFAIPLERDASGMPLRVYGIDVDITESRKIEDQLSEERSILRQLLDANPDLMFVKDASGHYLAANVAYAKLVGTSPGEIEGRTDADLFPPEIAAEFRDEDKAVMASGREFALTSQQCRIAPDPARWFDIRKIPIKDANGNVSGIYAAVTEVSERKRMLDLLALETRVLALIAARAPVPQTMDVLNSGFEAFWPGSISSILLYDSKNMTLQDCSGPSLPSFYRSAIDGLAIGPAVGSCGTALWRRQPVIVENIAESPLWAPFVSLARAAGLASCWSTPVLSSDGDPLGTFAVYWHEPRGPTADEHVLIERMVNLARLALENARAETELSAYRNDLERLVRERSEQLVATNRDLQAFTYSLSHDLRTPLRGIDGFSQALVEDYGHLLDERARAYVDRVRRATHRLGRLIDDMMSLSRASLVDVHAETVDISDLARDIVEGLSHSEPARNVQVHVAPGLTVRADAGLMRILLENLLSNAWKFTRNTSPAVIRLDGDLLPDGIRLQIQDNGAGFDPAHANLLFMPFQRLHGSEEFEGTGLGLASVKRIAERHGGSASGEALADGGARFTVVLRNLQAVDDDVMLQ